MSSHEQERIISGSVLPDEQSFEYSLRPERLSEYIGQQKVKDNLSIAIEAAKARGGRLVLFKPIELVANTLEVAGITAILPIFHDMDAASAAATAS